MDYNLDNDVACEDQLLDPPPGFEDPRNDEFEERYYDDPYDDSRPVLSQAAVAQFAGSFTHSLMASVIKPKVKMRIKKPPNISSGVDQQELYSLPLDNLGTNSEVNKRHVTDGRHKTRHSIAVPDNSEPIHMTLDEVRSYLCEFHQDDMARRRPWMLVPSKSMESDSRHKSCFVWTPHLVSKTNSFDDARTKRNRKSLSVAAAGIKQALFSVFRMTTHHHGMLDHHEDSSSCNQVCSTGWTFSMPDRSQTLQHSGSPHQRRALPPLPQEPIGFVRVPSRPSPLPPSQFGSMDLNPCETTDTSPSILEDNAGQSSMDFAASIEAVKDHGWYWGPLSGEAAEKILSGEPDGSFLVRDSSDDHYIFSLSFKLNGGVRHVRIEHDHGNFSFGSVARFRSQTMVEFIDKAIEHSRSGRYLFFLHRRPTHGPTRVQLLHPVSRFRQVQSLQHLSRFVILKIVRRDQIARLPLPKCLQDYLNTAHYYSEQLNGSTHHSP